MPKRKDAKLSFPPSPSKDVIGYKLYIETSPTEVTYDSPSHYLRRNTSVRLYKILGVVDGVFNIGVVAVDDAGNESNFSLLYNVHLDFISPFMKKIAIIITRVLNWFKGDDND